MHLFCLQTPPRENWFQYIRREYATAIKFSCLITLQFKVFFVEFKTKSFLALQLCRVKCYHLSII